VIRRRVPGLPSGRDRTEMRMVAGAWSAATASVGVSEKTERYAVLGLERRPGRQTPRRVARRYINQKGRTMTIIMLPAIILDWGPGHQVA
jgi:hypothetical protein